MQFDVRRNQGNVQSFLEDHGFANDEIDQLSQRGGLSNKQIAALNTKLQTIPREKIDEFTNQQLEASIYNVEKTIQLVRKENPINADVIARDPELQLAIADYQNQFGAPDGKRHGTQFVSFLAGKPESLPGGVTQAHTPPTYKDVQNFIDATEYGVAQHKKDQKHDSVISREERLDQALAKLGFEVTSHTLMKQEGNSTLKQGMHGDAVKHAQEELHELGYLKADPDGRFGTQTKDATKDFQRAQGLDTDGKIGTITQGRLNAAVRDQRISDVTAGIPPLRDFSDPSHPQNALYNTLKEGFPANASPEFLAQATAACYMSGIKHPDDLGNVFGRNGKLVFESHAELPRNATLDMTRPTPSIQQTMQAVQTHDQNQAQIQTTIQQQIAQNNLQGPQGPTPGGR